MLTYLPFSLIRRTFNELDISNNNFVRNDVLKFDHIYVYLKLLNQPNERINILEKNANKLCHQAFFSLIKNCVKFKRQDIPRTLWHYFNVVGHCAICNKYVLPDCSVVNHYNSAPFAVNIVRNHSDSNIPWQRLTCRISC